MAENENRNSNKQRPVHEIRLGTVKAVIWANTVESGRVMHSVVPVRVYRDNAGNWHETHSLGRNDLLVAAKALDLAHTYIVEAERGQPAGE